MLTKLRQRMQSEKGFTLIELLVVILIIGILAAIAIPSFLSQKNKANDANAESAVRTAQTAMETYSTSNNGDYTGADVSALQAIEPTLNDGPATSLVVGGAISQGDDASTLSTSPTADSYTVAVKAQSTGNWYEISRQSDGSVKRLCYVTSASKPGACHITGSNQYGTWGPSSS